MIIGAEKHYAGNAVNIFFGNQLEIMAGVVITFGTFDLLHVGHVNILERSRALGDQLVVGVSSDAFNKSKGKVSVYSESERMRIVGALQCVDKVFLEESMEAKPGYITSHGADVLCMGDDWAGRFDDMPCKVVYLPRTPGVSTSQTKAKLRVI